MTEREISMAENAIEKYLGWLIDLDLKREANAVSKINAACTAIHTALDVLDVSSKMPMCIGVDSQPDVVYVDAVDDLATQVKKNIDDYLEKFSKSKKASFSE